MRHIDVILDKRSIEEGEAAWQAYRRFLVEHVEGVGDLGELGWAFSAGFNRGIKWALKFMEEQDGGV